MASVIIVGYALTVITEYILSKNDIEELKLKKMQKKIDSLSNHIIICGYGRNGKQAAKKLLDHKRSFVIIEANNDIDLVNKMAMLNNSSKSWFADSVIYIIGSSRGLLDPLWLCQ